MCASSLTVAAVLLLLIPWASAQATQCAPDDSSQLRYVAQLNVSGCALFVYDTGAKDGPHLALEPIMCVTESLHKVAPNYDPVNQQTYVSVPVMLRDDAMLAEVQRQLRHLSPKSVKFAAVSDISVSTDNSSKFRALEFIWTPEETVGFLRLSCKLYDEKCSICNLTSKFRSNHFEALEQAILSAKVASNESVPQLKYRLTIQNQSFTDPEFLSGRFNCLPECQQLRFVRSNRLNNCIARVYQRLDMKGHFLIEPLLCHNITSMSNEPVMYDYSRDMYYLKLDVVLKDDMTADAVRIKLADLSPRSVTFMRLWRAQSIVASALSRRFVIGPLMVSGDGRSAQLRVYCKASDECVSLRRSVVATPIEFWKNVKFSMTSLVSDRCILKSAVPKHPWRMQEDGKVPASLVRLSQTCLPETQIRKLIQMPGKLIQMPDERWFIKIQQRLTGTVSFQRPWIEYEEGFGDETDFWIGLKTINGLTGSSPRLLRVEAVTWSGRLFVSEYSGFTVSDASTAYTMTFGSCLAGSSNMTHDSLDYHRGRKFSTFDRDHSGHDCSAGHAGRGGWWYSVCALSNPNGIYQASANTNGNHNMFWAGADAFNALKSIRLMLQL